MVRSQSMLQLRDMSESVATWQKSVSMSMAYIITREHVNVLGPGSRRKTTSLSRAGHNWLCPLLVVVLWRAGPISHKHSGE